MSGVSKSTQTETPPDTGEFQDITLERVRELAPEAFREALARYPIDVKGALIFFSAAIGLSISKPTAEDVAWAREVMRSQGR